MDTAMETLFWMQINVVYWLEYCLVRERFLSGLTFLLVLTSIKVSFHYVGNFLVRMINRCQIGLIPVTKISSWQIQLLSFDCTRDQAISA